ncbi:PREDICTED: O-acetyl-ADP-ribose deacetylase MACROD1 [Elephantulus edwardii]|uniref:O-acetyl-ADP-ribose deacetylase MACROD1 n=1 Tax=Elephantulus edwardii TaxID=28737 RepID=UPI0003F07E7A|nr:PREDICTED: O-acetyl-ADP-ribose deacetylase MACROD1 [Elephantulus edwardii]
MSLQSRVAGRLAPLRAAGQLLVAPRPRPGPSAGARRPRSSACSPLASLGSYGLLVRTLAGVGAWGAAAVGRRAGVRTWAPLAMAAKVDLSTSTDWKAAKSFLKGLSDKQREEHYFCRDFVRLKKIPTWKEMAKGVAVKVEEPKYKKDKHLNDKISLFRGDITKLEVDAIVNAANSSLLGGGGVDGCIHRAAGPLLTDECRTLQSCDTGKAKITCGYRLPAKYVIHTVGPIAHGEPTASQVAELRSCYQCSLDLLLEHRLRSVAFPCISTGVFGYPNEAAAEVVLTTLREWLEQHKDKVDRLVICVFLEKDEDIYRQRLPHYFPVAGPHCPLPSSLTPDAHLAGTTLWHQQDHAPSSEERSLSLQLGLEAWPPVLASAP